MEATRDTAKLSEDKCREDSDMEDNHCMKLPSLSRGKPNPHGMGACRAPPKI